MKESGSILETGDPDGSDETLNDEIAEDLPKGPTGSIDVEPDPGDRGGIGSPVATDCRQATSPWHAGDIQFPIEKVRVTLVFDSRNDPYDGSSKRHTGVDINPWPGSRGRPVYSPVDGCVEEMKLGGHNRGYGNYIIISARLPLGFYTKSFYREDLVYVPPGEPISFFFAHMNDIYFIPGQYVQMGQQVGEIGDSGNAFGAHVHFEIRRGRAKSTDPANLLKEWVRQVPLDPLGLVDRALPTFRSRLVDSTPKNSKGGELILRNGAFNPLHFPYFNL